jgi:hypothetical protein
MKFFKETGTGNGIELLALVVAQSEKLAHHHEQGSAIQSCEKLQQRA